MSEDFDVDDVGALCAAHGLVELGEAEILSVGKEIRRIRIFNFYILSSVHNVGYPRAIGAVSVINHFYGRDDIQLGAFKGDFGANFSGKQENIWMLIKTEIQGLTQTRMPTTLTIW